MVVPEIISADRLTVVLLTYNRLHYLKKAIESCLTQSNHNFNLLVINNASSDGTTNYLSNLSITGEIHFKSISNIENLGPKISFLVALNQIENSNWVTILCDDDVLDVDYVERFYKLRTLYPKSTCITTSVAEIDVCDNILSTFINPTAYFDSKKAFELICNGRIRPAGISGFAFPARLKKNINLSHRN